MIKVCYALIMAIKREMILFKQGNRSAEVLDYIKSLSANEVADSNDLKLLDSWNRLQNYPKKTTKFMFSLTRFNFRVQKYLQNNFPNNLDSDNKRIQYPHKPFYAYIKHDKDTDTSVHWHYFIEFENARSFPSVAYDLGIPVTMLNQVRYTGAFLEYLTHKNEAKKHHYSPDEVICNFDLDSKIHEEKDDNECFRDFYYDYGLLRRGKITPDEMIMKYEIYIVRHCSFYQRAKLISGFYDDFGKWVR